MINELFCMKQYCIIRENFHRPLHELEMLWLKDGILVENSGISYDFKDPWNRTLSLVGANLTHTGQYTCQVRLRSGGFPTVSASATVTVLGNYILIILLWDSNKLVCNGKPTCNTHHDIT
jgi:hypothetical protein